MKIQMSPDEVDYIDGLLSGPINYFVEWGSGGSSIHWAAQLRRDQRLIVIEHDRKWCDLVSNTIGNNSMVTIFWAPEDEGVIEHGYGVPSEENPVGLLTYIHPPFDLGAIDMFLIDGVARGAVLASLRHLAKRDAIILLHDAPRRWTEWAETLFPKRELVANTLMRLGL